MPIFNPPCIVSAHIHTTISNVNHDLRLTSIGLSSSRSYTTF